MIDLHTHTDHSDGALSGAELLTLALQNKIELLSITDHNNVEAYFELEDWEENKKIKIIKGVELEFVYDGYLMDMLGYGIDLHQIKKSDIMIEGLVHTTIEKENERLKFYQKVCDQLEIKYTKGLRIKKANMMGNDVLVDDILTYPENQNHLQQLGIFDRTTFYRNHVLQKNSPFFLDLTQGKFDLFYVTDVIHKAHGKCFLAHPFVYPLEDIKKFLDYLVSLNIIDGIECYHRKHTEEQIAFLVQYCIDHHLLMSGGSDYHNQSHTLGKASNGEISIEEKIVKNWISSI